MLIKVAKAHKMDGIRSRFLQEIAAGRGGLAEPTAIRKRTAKELEYSGCCMAPARNQLR